MDRRVVGIVTLLIGLLAVALLPGLNGRGTVGTAQRVAVPLIGECVLVGPPADPGADGTSSAGSAADPMLRLSAVLGDCADPAAARVIASRPESLLASASAQDYSSTRAAFCSEAVETARGRAAPGTGFVWQRRDVQIGVRPQVLLDAELAVSPQVVGGPRWTVCYASDEAGRPVPVVDAESPIDALGSCFRDDAVGVPSPIGCSLPHTSQLLGTAGQIAGYPTPTDYRLACRDFAAVTIGVPDATAGAALQLLSVERTSPQGGQGECRISVVDENRTLSGSLIGLGDRPLPWTG